MPSSSKKSIDQTVFETYGRSQGDFDYSKMLGTWYIMQTNLSFWKSRQNPRITYSDNNTASTQPCSDSILDRVQYGKQLDKPSIVSGIDTPSSDYSNAFHWRGNQWYSFYLTSDWMILDCDPESQQWAVTYFQKTMFTDAGMDIYARDPNFFKQNPDILSQITNKFKQDPLLKPHVEALFDASFSPQVFSPDQK